MKKQKKAFGPSNEKMVWKFFFEIVTGLIAHNLFGGGRGEEAEEEEINCASYARCQN
jgi:hypothetical protein